MVCSTCGRDVERVEEHHVLPVILGGIEAASNKIKICGTCHGVLHGSSTPWPGIARAQLREVARSRGYPPGAPPGNTNRTGKKKQMPESLVVKFKELSPGKSLRTLASIFGVSLGTAQKWKKQLG